MDHTVPRIRWLVGVELNTPLGIMTNVYRGCEGETASEAIDYALEVMGELVEGYYPNRAYAVQEAHVTEPVILTRVRYPQYRRSV